MPRKIKMKPIGVETCPKCGNNTDFTIHSNQCAEDYCEVWATCKCGFDTPGNFRLESVMGGVDDDNCLSAVNCWNEYISSLQQPNEDQQEKDRMSNDWSSGRGYFDAY